MKNRKTAPSPKPLRNTMSVTRSYTPEIVIPQPQITACQGNIRGTPCMEIMQRALAKIASEHSGQVTTSYRDCRGVERPVVLGLSTPQLPKGLGVDVEKSGKVVFRYDAEGADRRVAESLSRDVARAYAVIAVLRAQNKLGYSVQVSGEETTATGRRVRTTAVRA